MSNTQHELGKKRLPRVQITYDVEVGDAKIVKELPLVIGVMGDFSKSESSLRERKFIKVDKENFDGIMSSMSPEAVFKVDSVLPEQNGYLIVSLKFNEIEDFSPTNIARQIDPLRKLLELREQLCDLRNRVASNERLREQVSEILEKQNFINQDQLLGGDE